MPNKECDPLDYNRLKQGDLGESIAAAIFDLYKIPYVNLQHQSNDKERGPAKFVYEGRLYQAPDFRLCLPDKRPIAVEVKNKTRMHDNGFSLDTPKIEALLKHDKLMPTFVAIRYNPYQVMPWEKECDPLLDPKGDLQHWLCRRINKLIEPGAIVHRNNYQNQTYQVFPRRLWLPLKDTLEGYIRLT